MFGLIVSAFGSCQPEVVETDCEAGSVQDIDGNTYQVVQIGSQCWFAENLRTTRFANGDQIPTEPDSASWLAVADEVWVHYNNDSQYDATLGKLYGWEVIADPRNICPDGWHVPTDAEYFELIEELGNFFVAGGKMKSVDTTYWYTPNVGATNSSGFNAHGAGGRGQGGDFADLGQNAYFWTSTSGPNGVEQTPATDSVAWICQLRWHTPTAIVVTLYKTQAISCRCVKD